LILTLDYLCRRINMKCKHCKTVFIPRRPLQNWCSPDCGYELAKIAQAKKVRAKDRVKKESLYTITHYRKKAQTAFNKFIQLRDAGLPRISCGNTNDCQYHAGHYMSAGGHAWLAYNEFNTNRQCQHCNTSLSGNLIYYRKGLIAKYGIEVVESLENSGQDLNKKSYTKEELLEIEKAYKLKIKEMGL